MHRFQIPASLDRSLLRWIARPLRVCCARLFVLRRTYTHSFHQIASLQALLGFFFSAALRGGDVSIGVVAKARTKDKLFWASAKGSLAP